MIILMGLAGSGKSTQGQLLAEKTGRIWLSAGQVLRDIPNEEIHELQRQGELVPDTTVIPLMTAAMEEILARGEDLILDGYPRTGEQTKQLISRLRERIEMVVRIIVPKPELVQRMRLRGRADDQSLEAIEERLRLVEQNIYTICGLLTEAGVKIVDVDGVGTVEEVAERLNSIVTEVENEQKN